MYRGEINLFSFQHKARLGLSKMSHLTLSIYGWYVKRISWNIFFFQTVQRDRHHTASREKAFYFVFLSSVPEQKKGKVAVTGSSWAAEDMFFVPRAGCHSHPGVSVFPSTPQTSRVNSSCTFSSHVWLLVDHFFCLKTQCNKLEFW